MQIKKILSIALLLSISMSVFAQTTVGEQSDTLSTPKGRTTKTNYTIKGIVADEQSSEGVPYATVSLKKDSVAPNFLKRVAADVNGKFEIEVSLDSGMYLVHIEAVGYQTILQPIEFSDNKKVDAGKFLMKEANTELSEVQVVAVKPLVTQDLDKIGYNVEADPESATNNALEMLRKVPLVTVDGEENIKVKGSSSFKIYLNGKPSNMITKNPKDVLKSMPASSIKKIEVITDPGAKYDAEGVTAILNIVTQSALQGVQGNISARANTKGNLGGSFYISSKIGKFGITANYGYNQYSSPYWQTVEGNFFSETTPYKSLNTYSEGRYKGDWHWGNLELSYEFDTLNLLSASFGVNGGKFRRPNDSLYTCMSNAALETVGAYIQQNNSKNTYFGLNGNIDYQRTFKKPEQLLTISYLFDLSPDNSENITKIRYDNNFPTDLNPPAFNQKFINHGKTDEHTFQIDYTEPFKDKKHTIEAGLKYVMRLNFADNDYKLYDDLTGKYDRDTARLTNDMQYFQHIFGAYCSYTFKLKKFSMRVGARLEGTFRDIRYPETPNKNFRDTIPQIDPIPSIALSYKPTEKSTLKLSYTNSISRPSIWYLNPYRDDSDPRFLSYGNPDLKSERSHNVAFDYGFNAKKFSLNISASYNIVNNSIENYSFVDTAGVINFTYENIGKNQRIGGNIYLNYTPWKWLRLWLQGGGNYTGYQNNDYSEENFRFNAWGGANFTLPWKLKINVSGGYYSPWAGYKYKGSPWYSYSFSISRNFLKGDKLTVTLSANNPFEQYRTFTGKRWDENIVDGKHVKIFEYKYNSKQIVRDFGISISWRFGEMKAQIKKAERGISNDDVKAGGGNQGGGGGGGN